jgi:hypothetical protein
VAHLLDEESALASKISRRPLPDPGDGLDQQSRKLLMRLG